MLADVGHLHEFEHRLPSSRLCDELEDSHQGFGWELSDDAEFVPGSDNAPGRVFEGGKKRLQLIKITPVSTDAQRVGT